MGSRTFRERSAEILLVHPEIWRVSAGMKRIVLILSHSIATIAFADVRPAPADVFSEAIEHLADVYNALPHTPPPAAGCSYANGVASLSPALRGTSYAGCVPPWMLYPERVESNRSRNHAF